MSEQETDIFKDDLANVNDDNATQDDAAAGTGESLTVNGEDVPIIRAGMPDLFVALRPPEATPYIMAPQDATPEQIIEFYAEVIPRIEELREDMRKRFAKTSSRKCRYQTGDVAYVLGRPFQLRVYPLSQGKGNMKDAARMRTTAKYAIDPDVSLLSLYVVHPKNYDEAKLAFNGYAETVLLNNANGMVADFGKILVPDGKLPKVRMRAMRGRWAEMAAGVLWLSTDLIPYPPDCLVYVIWKELEKLSPLPEDEINEQLERILPGWREAARLLSRRPEPYNLQ